MKSACDEIIRRFPELVPRLYEGDEELAYVLMGEIAQWLKTLDRVDLKPELVQRILELKQWCFDQPRGQTASDDAITLWYIGFVEELFDSDVTRALLPHLLPEEHLLEDPEYWKRWVKPESYHLALEEYRKSNSGEGTDRV